MKRTENTSNGTETLDTPFPVLWRHQCARNLMDCYALAMEAGNGGKPFESLVRLMVDGMTAVKNEEDEKVFYRATADSCRKCAGELGASDRARFFKIYAAIFEDLSR